MPGVDLDREEFSALQRFMEPCRLAGGCSKALNSVAVGLLAKQKYHETGGVLDLDR